MKFGLMFKRL